MSKLMLFVALLGLSVVAASHEFTEEHYQQEFIHFMTRFQRKYTHETFFPRYNVFKSSLDFVTEFNKNANRSFTVGINQFADWTRKEFVERNRAFNINRDYARSRNTENLNFVLADSLDWRTQNAVTGVKDQGQCGSCWSFSTTGSVEGASAIASGTLTSLSEQQLVDCSSAQGNQGCNGGWMDQAFEYIIQNQGITTEDQYPYQGSVGTCNTGVTAAVTITGYTDVTKGDENALMQAATVGPVSITIEADQSSFQYYSGGVFDDPSCGTNLDHAVLVVGYGTDNGQDYWIVKNSWGTSWGEAGYIRMIRAQNECGLSNAASYPTGASA